MIHDIPIIRIVLMAVVILVALFTPFVLAIVMKKKADAKFSVFFTGMGAFVVSGLLLSDGIYELSNSLSGGFLEGDGFAPSVICALIQSVCEEMCKFVVMRFIMKFTLQKENAIMYAAGHGGIEMIINYGVAFIALMIMSFTASPTDESPLRDAPFINLCMFPVLVLVPFMMCIGLSYLVFKSVKEKKIICLFVAIFIHALCNTLVVVIPSEILGMGIISVIVLSLFIYTIIDYKKNTEEFY